MDTRIRDHLPAELDLRLSIGPLAIRYRRNHLVLFCALALEPTEGVDSVNRGSGRRALLDSGDTQVRRPQPHMFDIAQTAEPMKDSVSGCPRLLGCIAIKFPDV